MGIKIVETIVGVLANFESLVYLVDILMLKNVIAGRVSTGNNGVKSFADGDGLKMFDGSNFFRIGGEIILIFGVKRMAKSGAVDDDRQTGSCRNCGQKDEV